MTAAISNFVRVLKIYKYISTYKWTVQRFCCELGPLKDHRIIDTQIIIESIADNKSSMYIIMEFEPQQRFLFKFIHEEICRESVKPSYSENNNIVVSSNSVRQFISPI